MTEAELIAIELSIHPFNFMNIEQDERTNSVNYFARITSTLTLIGILAIVVGVWLIVLDKRAMRTKQDYDRLLASAQQIVKERDNAFEIANRRQQFINEAFVHIGRFFTNDHVNELEWAPNRISTFVDTNHTFMGSFDVTITATNVSVKRHARFRPFDSPQTNRGSILLERSKP